jgi:hypothetical protein
MESTKRQVLPSRPIVVGTISLLVSVAICAGALDGPDAKATRHVSGRTIISEKLPKAKLTLPKGFRFIGNQQINLYGNAEAEQYVFARSSTGSIVESFYLLQFEHFLPTNNLTYKYDAMQPTQIGDLPFIYDVKGFSDLAATVGEDQASDGAAVERLLAKQDLSLQHKCVLVRMIHLPSPDHRTELLILYGEALPLHSDVPIGEDGVHLDTELSGMAQAFLDHARNGLIVRER